jgi:hypothetical protein
MDRVREQGVTRGADRKRATIYWHVDCGWAWTTLWNCESGLNGACKEWLQVLGSAVNCCVKQVDVMLPAMVEPLM